jgi:hypothetical protein
MTERIRPILGVNDALAQAQFAEKKWVWVADKEEGYLAGWITEEKGEKVVVEFPDNQVTKKNGLRNQLLINI